ncbi:MAG: polyhydroxyalkanoic acid system family protein [Burkholderiaceae bacterium]|jgi:putative polyhydroxyalkanoate system protein|nr:polyhydroxyalkanoic acid system family protein [Burkholderiaceae bacterium]
MSDIKYVREHSLPLKQAKAIAQKTADDLAEEYDLHSEWDGNTLLFHRSGVEGQMVVTPEAIALDVKLGFLLKPFKAKFEQHIERHLDELLAQAPVARAKPAGKAVAKPARSRKA